MYKYMLKHERWITNLLLCANEAQDWNAIREYHMTQIGFLQHERLVHLIITLAFAFFMIASIVATVFHTAWPMLLLDLMFTTLVVFYIIHYYRLENGVQRWYRIYEQLCVKADSKLDSAKT